MTKQKINFQAFLFKLTAGKVILHANDSLCVWTKGKLSGKCKKIPSFFLQQTKLYYTLFIASVNSLKLTTQIQQTPYEVVKIIS